MKTKKEMVLEILDEVYSRTRIRRLHEKEVQQIVDKNSKERITEVYAAFTKDKEHARFYYGIL